ILIVDDEEIIHHTLKRQLKSGGYAIDSAYGGKDALRKINAGYDLIICDIRMPGMNGIGLLKEIRKKKPDAEVLLLTGYVSHEIVTVAMNYGILGYFMKPLEKIPEFRCKVREAT
ncbi:MAG: response regulator, partial [Bacteroidales bacterium]|nr:response regulator [Bacteroidales bacterium]